MPTHRISRHVPANGKPSVNKAWSNFKEFVDSVFDNEGKYRVDIEYIKKPSKLCEWCQFLERDLGFIDQPNLISYEVQKQYFPLNVKVLFSKYISNTFDNFSHRGPPIV